MTLPRIAVTCGEPAGIGPEILAMLAARHARTPFGAQLVFVADRALLDARARRIALAPAYVDVAPAADAPTGAVAVWHLALPVPVRDGTPDPASRP